MTTASLFFIGTLVLLLAALWFSHKRYSETVITYVALNREFKEALASSANFVKLKLASENEFRKTVETLRTRGDFYKKLITNIQNLKETNHIKRSKAITKILEASLFYEA